MMCAHHAIFCNGCEQKILYIYNSVCKTRVSRVQLSVTLWTVACQAPLSRELFRQEYQSGLPFPSPGNLPDPGSKPGLLHWSQSLYSLSYQRKPRKETRMTYSNILRCFSPGDIRSDFFPFIFVHFSILYIFYNEPAIKVYIYKRITLYQRSSL